MIMMAPRQATALLLLAVLAGCAAPVKEQPQSGFLSRYDQLEQADERAYEYFDPALGGYAAFLIETPEILFEHDPEQWSEEDLDEIKLYFSERLEKALTEDEGYTLADHPGPGVACIRVGLTALDASNGALNLSIYTKITGAGLGGAAMEGEIVDTLTGRQLAATIRWGSGSRVLRAGLTRLGDAKIQINRWTKALRKSLDALPPAPAPPEPTAGAATAEAGSASP